MVIFNSYVKLPEGILFLSQWWRGDPPFGFVEKSIPESID